MQSTTVLVFIENPVFNEAVLDVFRPPHFHAHMTSNTTHSAYSQPAHRGVPCCRDPVWQGRGAQAVVHIHTLCTHQLMALHIHTGKLACSGGMAAGNVKVAVFFKGEQNLSLWQDGVF